MLWGRQPKACPSEREVREMALSKKDALALKRLENKKKKNGAGNKIFAKNMANGH